MKYLQEDRSEEEIEALEKKIEDIQPSYWDYFGCCKKAQSSIAKRTAWLKKSEEKDEDNQAEGGS